MAGAGLCPSGSLPSCLPDSPRQLLASCVLAPRGHCASSGVVLAHGLHGSGTVHGAEVPVLQLRKLRHRAVVLLARHTQLMIDNQD